VSILNICKKGYGTLQEIKKLHVDEFLDILEYENIINTVEEYYLEKQRKEIERQSVR
jgi:hypothetical protein